MSNRTKTPFQKMISTLLLFWFTTLANADDSGSFIDESTRYLSEADLLHLDTLDTPSKLKEKFGEPMKADGYAIGWPKQAHQDSHDELTQWKRGYWFFYKLNERGRPSTKLGLQFVASLTDDVKDDSKPLIELFPHMTIDWPVEDKGKRLFGVYFGR